MPNWVSNVLVLRPEDAKKVEEFIDVVEENGMSYPRFDFNKIIPMPDTVYNGNVGFGDDWHPKDMSLEDYRAKFPDGNWYDWSCNNWGCKWNASSVDYHPPEEGDEYGTLWFNTPWGTPTPVMVEMHFGKGVDFIHYYTEEADFFRGAVAYTKDTNYPEYLHDPEGKAFGYEIYEFVHGQGEYDWMFDDEFQRIEYWVDTLITFIRDIQRKWNSYDRSCYISASEYTDLTFALEVAKGFEWLDKYPEEQKARTLSNYMADYPVHSIQSKIEDRLTSDVPRLAENTEGWHPLMKLMSMVRETVAELRKRALNERIGLTRERAKEIIDRAYLTFQVNEPRYKEYKNEGIDNLLGRRILYDHLIHKWSGLSIASSLSFLAEIRRETITREQLNNGKEKGELRYQDDQVFDALDISEAMVQLYNELPDMTGEEFLRLMENYSRSNLFMIDLTGITNLSAKIDFEIQDQLRKFRVIQFKNAFRLGRL